MINLYAWFGYVLSRERLFAAIREDGFDGTTLWWSAYGWTGESARLDYKGQAEAARKAGLWVENIHVPFWDINSIWEDTEMGGIVAQNLLECVDDCAAYEIPAMVVHASRGDSLPPLSELGIRRFEALVERAERLGVNVAVENLRKPEPIERASFILERFDSPRLGFCFDSGHHNARTVITPETDMLARFGHRLMALHLHDNDGTDDQHRPPFDGTTDWPIIMGRIKATGYRGAIHLEVHNDDGYQGIPPEKFLAMVFERAKRLEALWNDLSQLKGKIQFVEGYDYKALRQGYSNI